MSYNGGTTDDTTTREPEVLFCANHPTVPTVLRCSRCGKPICARCRVATPVGYRCVECAQLQSVPTYALSNSYYAKSIGTGLAAAVGIGVLWGLFPGFDFWAALIMGVVVGEGVSWAANMKRGPGLQAVGVLAVVVGVLVSRVVFEVAFRAGTLGNFLLNIPGNSLPPSIFLGLDVLGLVFVAMALGLAYYRLR